METPSAELLGLAARVLARERTRHPHRVDKAQNGDGDVLDDDWAPAMLTAFRGLADAMTKLVGEVGFDALLRRAIYLTRRQHAWLERVPIGSPVALEQLAEQAHHAGVAQASTGATSLFGMMLHLFCTFLGSDLTMRQIENVWPDLPEEPGSAGEEKE